MSKDDKNKYLFYQREFLNEEGHQSLAAVYGQIKVGWHSKIKQKKGMLPDYEDIIFNISDCIRRIDLEFDARDDEEEWQNSLKKIRKLESFVTEFRKGLEELYELRKPLIQEKSDNKISEISDEFSNFFAENNINGKEVLNFDFEKEKENIYKLTLFDIEEKALKAPSLNEFSKKIESKYGIQIKITVGV